MAQTTIEWTATRNGDGTSSPGYTFNPWMGCTKVSAGCKHCYAETLMDKRYDKVTWGPQGQRVRTSPTYWKQPLSWDRKAAQAGQRARVFCASLADVFEDNPQVVNWRSDLWSLIDQTPNLDWLLLSKRPENIELFLPFKWTENILPGNIWLGTSAENQETFDERWTMLDNQTHHLLPSVLFLSLEPLLGPIDISAALEEIDWGGSDHTYWTRSVDWVIVGAESGPNARPMNEDWVRSIRDQCVEAGVPFFYKQKAINGHKISLPELDGRRWAEFPIDIVKLLLDTKLKHG